MHNIYDNYVQYILIEYIYQNEIYIIKLYVKELYVTSNYFDVLIIDNNNLLSIIMAENILSYGKNDEELFNNQVINIIEKGEN